MLPRYCSFADLLNGCFPILGVENGAARDQPVRPGLCNQPSILGTDTPIDLDVEGWVLAAQVADFVKHLGHEFLAAEARLDSHY